MYQFSIVNSYLCSQCLPCNSTLESSCMATAYIGIRSLIQLPTQIKKRESLRQRKCHQELEELRAQRGRLAVRRHHLADRVVALPLRAPLQAWPCASLSLSAHLNLNVLRSSYNLMYL